MPVRNMRPEDEQPLARSANEQRLARPASEEQAEVTREEAEEGQTAPPADEAPQGDKGPVARAMDSAQENNWVYGSVAEKTRETGLVDKVDEILDKAKDRLSSG